MDRQYAVWLFSITAIIMCSGQMCGAPAAGIDDPIQEGIPEGVYTGTVVTSPKVTVYSSSGTQVQNGTATESSGTAEFGPEGSLLNTSKIPVAIGDSIPLVLPVMVGEMVVTSTSTGDGFFTITSSVNMLMQTPGSLDVIALSGSRQEKYTFVAPDSVQYTSKIVLLSSPIGGSYGAFEFNASGTLNR